MVKLGSKVRDKVNGLTGIAGGRTIYLTGCVQVGIIPEALKPDGGVADWHWVDEQRVEVLQEGAFIPEASEAEAGGPQGTVPPSDGAPGR